jgi:hypothetical protein
MEREDYAPPIRVLHFDVAAFTMNFPKAQTLQPCMNLPA